MRSTGRPKRNSAEAKIMPSQVQMTTVCKRSRREPTMPMRLVASRARAIQCSILASFGLAGRRAKSRCTGGCRLREPVRRTSRPTVEIASETSAMRRRCGVAILPTVETKRRTRTKMSRSFSRTTVLRMMEGAVPRSPAWVKMRIMSPRRGGRDEEGGADGEVGTDREASARHHLGPANAAQGVADEGEAEDAEDPDG